MLPLTESGASPSTLRNDHPSLRRLYGGKCMSPLKGTRITFLAALIFACSGAIANGQEFRGSITGRIVDNNGAAVANAAVTVTNKATNTSSSTTTNGDGDYTALYLIPGSYSVFVEATGFK